MPSVFFSYAHADQGLRDELEKHLATLKRQGVIDTWHDRRIEPGQDFAQTIDEHVNVDNIILLLVSSDFLNSDYCYTKEMERALERHEAADAIVIPVILRASDWHSAPFGRLQATPPDGKPITQWPDRDEAFMHVVQAVRKAAMRWQSAGPASSTRSSASTPAVTPAVSQLPRSSNLRLAKSFTPRDKDQFLLDAFSYVKRFFQGSLAELGARNPGFEGIFREVDANRFFATVYKDGHDVAKATIFMGGESFRNGINYVQGHSTSNNSLNESLSVEADDQALYLKSLGMTSFAQDREPKMTLSGAAEYLWSEFVRPLQQRAW